MIFTHSDLSIAVVILFLFHLTNASQRTLRLIKSKTSNPCALAGSGVVLGRRKSPELIMRKVCSLFGGETAGQRDIVKIKARGKTRHKTRQRDKQTEMFLLYVLQYTRNNQRLMSS